jgi:hypothetical protein
MKKLIINPENPQGILVDLTSEEIATKEQDANKAEEARIFRQNEKESKEESKASALAKLSALGLTEEEVQAIIK